MIERNISRRGIIGGFAAGVGFAAAGSNGLIGAACAQSAPKTFIVVPGAFNGAWVWRRVSDLLEKKGHKVFALTLTGLGERSHLLSKDINLDTHITDIVNVIKWESLSDFCLVAHSYGGFPASGALEQVGNSASSIVWLDAAKPENGQKVVDVVAASLRERVQNSVEKGEISFPPLKPPAKLPPTVVNEKDAPFLQEKNTPQPIGTWLQPIKLSGARERVAKKTYVRFPKSPSAALDKALAECKTDNTWKTVELSDSGHMAMLDAPERLTDLLVQAA
jgi:hypothetical protein